MGSRSESHPNLKCEGPEKKGLAADPSVVRPANSLVRRRGTFMLMIDASALGATPLA